MAAREVVVKNLGIISYLEGLSAQKALQRTHLNYLQNNSLTKPKNTLFICEHKPVYTTGIRNSLKQDQMEKLKNLGAEFYSTKRGGLVTFHGPGQLVCYPVLNLGDFRKSIRWYVAKLEETLIKTCMLYGVKAKVTCDTGVWVEDRKIAAIGVQASRWITMHGIALNCNTDLNWFNHIVPCGIEGKGVTSLQKETNKDIHMQQALGNFVNCFSEVFECRLQTDEKLDRVDIK